MAKNVVIAFKNPVVEGAYHEGLGITANNAALVLRENKINAIAIPVPNGEFIWQALLGEWNGISHLVLEAPFIDADFLGRLFKSFPKVTFTILYHSNLGFLSQDQFAGASIPAYLALEAKYPNFGLSSNSLRFVRGIEAISGQQISWLPNLYPGLTSPVANENAHGAKILNIGLFGACRVLKNWLTASVAAGIIGKILKLPVNLHVSTGRDENAASTRKVLMALAGISKVNVIEVPWLKHPDFVKYVSQIDLLLQPSFSETWNTVTADGCSVGVPSVVSPAIQWVPDNWKAQPDDVVNVAEVGVKLLSDPIEGRRGWEALYSYNQSSIKAWFKWLDIPYQV